MKQHTTNDVNTFIAVAEDAPTAQGEHPPVKGDARLVANIQFDPISLRTSILLMRWCLRYLPRSMTSARVSEKQHGSSFLKGTTLFKGLSTYQAVWVGDTLQQGR